MHESQKTPFTRENLDSYLKDLAREFRKLNGNKMPADIVLIGGAAILANYGFRELTYDIDAIIVASSAMKDAISRMGDKHNLPLGWLNADFKNTVSYSDKLFEKAKYYKTFSNILTIRTIDAEYLLAMKLMSGRRYKNDLSDIVGILWEHQKSGNPISYESIINAFTELYGEAAVLPDTSMTLLDSLFKVNDYGEIYQKLRDEEKANRELLLDFEKEYPKQLGDNNTDKILSSKWSKDRIERKKSLLEKIEENKQLVENNKRSETENRSKNKNQLEK